MRVLIVDGLTLFAEALESALRDHGFEVVGVAATGAQATRMTRGHRPDLVLIDMDLPSSLEVGQAILSEAPSALVVGLNGHDDSEVVRGARAIGFGALVSKVAPLDHLIGLIVRSSGGTLSLPEAKNASKPGRSSPGHEAERLLARQLTVRERQVLALLTEGANTAMIARRLVLSPNTVRSHVQNIRSKLQVHSRLEAAAFAIRHGLTLRPIPEEASK